MCCDKHYFPPRRAVRVFAGRPLSQASRTRLLAVRRRALLLHLEGFPVSPPTGQASSILCQGTVSYTQVSYTESDLLIFGSETRGLSDEVRALVADSLYTIPMSGTHVRSLNLSTAAAIVLYEALRQLGRV